MLYLHDSDNELAKYKRMTMIVGLYLAIIMAVVLFSNRFSISKNVSYFIIMLAALLAFGQSFALCFNKNRRAKKWLLIILIALFVLVIAVLF